MARPPPRRRGAPAPPRKSSRASRSRKVEEEVVEEAVEEEVVEEEEAAEEAAEEEVEEAAEGEEFHDAVEEEEVEELGEPEVEVEEDMEETVEEEGGEGHAEAQEEEEGGEEQEEGVEYEEEAEQEGEAVEVEEEQHEVEEGHQEAVEEEAAEEEATEEAAVQEEEAAEEESEAKDDDKGTKRKAEEEEEDEVQVVSAPATAKGSQSKPKKARSSKASTTATPTAWGTSYHTYSDPSGQPILYPPISLTTIRTLKWGFSRELMEPFLTHAELANIHKKTRADLSEMLEQRILSGQVTPERFWSVVGLDKVVEREKKKKPVDDFVASALKKAQEAKEIQAAMAGIKTGKTAGANAKGKANNPIVIGTSVPGSGTLKSASVGSPVKASKAKERKNGKKAAKQAATAAAAAAAAAPGALPPGAVPPPWGYPYRPPPQYPPHFPPIKPRITYKYVVHAPTLWATAEIGYPCGIVTGEPNPPHLPLPPPPNRPGAPPPVGPTINGMFHSSAIIPMGLNKQVIGKNDPRKQSQYIFAKVDEILSHMYCTTADIVHLKAYVVDIYKNGAEVTVAQQLHMMGKEKKSLTNKSGGRGGYGVSFVGVSGLMPKGVLVSVEFTAVVNRAPMTAFVLER